MALAPALHRRTGMSSFLVQPTLLGKLRRDAGLPKLQLAAKIARAAAATATAPLYLRACDSVGAMVRTRGRPLIENSGRIEIGAGTQLVSSPVPLELHAGPRGRIEIGRGCIVNFGVVIAAESVVHLGDDVGIGPYTVISDTDGTSDPPRPIEI